MYAYKSLSVNILQDNCNLLFFTLISVWILSVCGYCHTQEYLEESFYFVD